MQERRHTVNLDLVDQYTLTENLVNLTGYIELFSINLNKKF